MNRSGRKRRMFDISLYDMERYFLGVNVVRKEENDYQEEAKQDDFRSFCSSYPLAGSSQRPFLSKGQLQQFMTIGGRVIEEERPRKIAYEPLAASGQGVISTADEFQAHHRATTTVKKNFTIDVNSPQLGQGKHFGLPCSTYPFQVLSQGTSIPYIHLPDLREPPFPSHHPISAGAAVINPYYRVYGAGGSANANSLAYPYVGIPATAHNIGLPIGGSVSASTNARRRLLNDATEPTSTAQLTIFYAGSVQVYDNVSADKAEEIMFLAGQQASSSGSTQINLANLVSSSTVIPSAEGIHVKTTISSGSGLLSPISRTATNQTQQSAGGSNCSNERGVVKTVSQLFSKTQSEPTKMGTFTVSIPQARKASLTRFLEMRKERLAGAPPYAKPSEVCNQRKIHVWR